jgi:hypothetical protein
MNGKKPKVSVEPLFDDKGLWAPVHRVAKKRRPKQAAGKLPKGDHSGPCALCGGQTTTRFDGRWCHIFCNANRHNKEDEL